MAVNIIETEYSIIDGLSRLISVYGKQHAGEYRAPSHNADQMDETLTELSAKIRALRELREKAEDVFRSSKLREF